MTEHDATLWSSAKYVAFAKLLKSCNLLPEFLIVFLRENINIFLMYKNIPRPHFLPSAHFDYVTYVPIRYKVL